MSLTRLNEQEIYDLLDYNWWIDSHNLGNPIFQIANIYYQDVIGNYHYFASTGMCPENSNGTIDPTTREYYIKNYLMKEASHQLYVGQCSGNISNTEPKEYQPKPIY